MARVRDIKPVKPICGITFAHSVGLEDILEALVGVMGREEERSEVFEFDHTTYYAEEMGEGLRKVFVGFRGVIEPGRLPEMKRRTIDLEARWSEDGNRRVNLDPGYVTQAKVVMASAKDFAHRVFIGDGIYGDVQLQYKDNEFRIQPWTFPDYRSETVLSFFHAVRDSLHEEVKLHD